MSWQAFSWQEIAEQAWVTQVADRLQPAVDRTVETGRELLEIVSVFLTPMALALGVVAFWRLSADLDIFGNFFVEDGLWSHWQVWCAAAIGVQTSAFYLKRWLKSTTISTPDSQS